MIVLRKRRMLIEQFQSMRTKARRSIFPFIRSENHLWSIIDATTTGSSSCANPASTPAATAAAADVGAAAAAAAADVAEAADYRPANAAVCGYTETGRTARRVRSTHGGKEGNELGKLFGSAKAHVGGVDHEIVDKPLLLIEDLCVFSLGHRRFAGCTNEIFELI